MSRLLILASVYRRGRDKIKGFHLYTFGKLRAVYDWVLSWAEHKHGTKALFGISFAEASFFPVPPDPLQIALSVSKPSKSFWYALVSTIASVCGGVLGWTIGLMLEPFGRWMIKILASDTAFAAVSAAYNKNAFLAIFSSALTPIPYKVFMIGAGIVSVPIYTVVLASVLGRGLRFFTVGTMIYFFGPKMKDFIDRYFNVLSFAFLIMLLGGFLSIKLLF